MRVVEYVSNVDLDDLVNSLSTSAKWGLFGYLTDVLQKDDPKAYMSEMRVFCREIVDCEEEEVRLILEECCDHTYIPALTGALKRIVNNSPSLLEKM